MLVRVFFSKKIKGLRQRLKWRGGIFLIKTLVFSPFMGFGQSDSTQQLPTYEVSSSRLNRYAIGQKQLEFDSFTLRKQPFQSISTLLQNETPLSVKAYGAGSATISMRGTGSSHTAILWNGFNIQSTASGLADISILEVVDNQRIGIKYGGGSAIYGSGAIGGAIYIDSDIKTTQGIHGSAALSSGSYGFWGQKLSLTTGSQRIATALNISHQTSKNDFIFKNIAEIGQPLQTQQNADFKKLNINGSVFFNLNKNNSLKFNYWNTNNNRGIPPTMTSRNDNARQDDWANRLATEWVHFNQKSVIKARFGLLDESILYNSNVVDSSKIRSQKFISEAEWNKPLTPNADIRLGINLTRERADKEETNIRKRAAFFANYSQKMGKMHLSLNIRQEAVDKQLIQPTASLGIEIPFLADSQNRFQLRGSASNNYNLPALNDLYWPDLGNPNLKPEHGFSGEFGVDFKHKQALWQSLLSASFFNIKTKNWILWQPLDGVWRPYNIETVWSRGLETQAKWEYKQGDFATQCTIQYQMTLSTDENGYQILFIPVHSASFSMRLNYKNTYLNFNENYSGKRYMTSDNATWTSAFALSNLTLGWSPNVKFTHCNLSFQINNIFNTNYQTIRFFAMPRRTWVITLNVSF